MLPIAVHTDSPLESLLQGVGPPRGKSEAFAFWLVMGDDLSASVSREFAGSIVRAVVDYDDMREGLAYFRDQMANGLFLVKARNDHGNVLGR